MKKNTIIFTFLLVLFAFCSSSCTRNLQNCEFGPKIEGSASYWKKMLENDEYEYLVFSNNDVSLHGYRFVETMVRQMQEGNFAMLSPSIIELNVQNFWPIMHCWYKDKPRETKWIDFICPFIHRKVVEKIEWPTWWRSPSYGFDDYAALVCGRENWKVGVSDLCTMFHF